MYDLDTFEPLRTLSGSRGECNAMQLPVRDERSCTVPAHGVTERVEHEVPVTRTSAVVDRA